MTLRSVQCAAGWCMLFSMADVGIAHVVFITGGRAITQCVRPALVLSELIPYVHVHAYLSGHHSGMAGALN